jgi:hypothetical protein
VKGKDTHAINISINQRSYIYMRGQKIGNKHKIKTILTERSLLLYRCDLGLHGDGRMDDPRAGSRGPYDKSPVATGEAEPGDAEQMHMLHARIILTGRRAREEL